MKKIVILIIEVLLTTMLYAQKQKDSGFEKMNLKAIESIVDEQFEKIDKETKALRVNRKEKFKLEETNAETIALSYLKEKYDLYGLNETLKEVRIVKVIESPAGKYVYCQQYMNDIPVYATNFTIYIDKENIIKYVLNEFRNIAKYEVINKKATITDTEALQTAQRYLAIENKIIRKPHTELVYFESIDRGLELVWKVNINSLKPLGDWQIFVSAMDKQIVHVEDIARYVNGTGKVYNPSPIVSAGVPYGYNNCYVDNNDSNNACLESQLKSVILKDITYEGGKYKLKGPYCIVTELDAPITPIPEPTSPDGFIFTRNQDGFEAVMCYYHIDASARRVIQLGYWDAGLNSIQVDPHGLDGDYNAYYMPGGNYMAFGGGANYVDAAEDADVIWHEHAHAIQHNLSPNGMSSPSGGETAAVMEGSSDYWGGSYIRSIYLGNWGKQAQWFMMGFSERRRDLDLKYPQNYHDGHQGGQIWSCALMKIWGDLGRDITDKLFLETHLIWGQSPSMQEAASAFMQADVNLYNGAHLCEIITHFNYHGLTDPSINYIVATNFADLTIGGIDIIVLSCNDLNVQNVIVEDNAKLTLDVRNTTTITGPFEVKLGSELEIK